MLCIAEALAPLRRGGWLLALAALSLAGGAPCRAEGPPLRVAIYADAGADGETLLPLARALALGGHLPLTVTADDLAMGLLTTTEFDVFVLPEGREGSAAGFREEIGGSGLEATIRDFVSAGGGFVGFGAGARYAAAEDDWDGTVATPGLALWDGRARGPLTGVGEGLGLVATEASWAAGWRDTAERTVFVGPGAAFFSGGGGEILARWSTGRGSDAEEQQPALLRFFYGAGRGVLAGPLPAVDVRSEGDWSLRDDRWLSSADAEHDQGLLLALVEWAGTGADRRPAHVLPAENPGRRVALYTTRTVAGGAYPALLTALARALEAAGAAPLAIGSREVWWAALDPGAFDLLVMPGGWAAGYVDQLSGVEQEIRDFVAAGGGYMGISAGAFYAADSVLWSGQSYDYPLDLFLGSLEGPLDEIAPWPEHVLTPLRMDDSEIGTGTWSTWYQGEGFFHLPPAEQQAVVESGWYDAAGPHQGTPAVVRHGFGAGRVIYPNLHLEVEEGSDRDWMFTGDRDADGPISDPDSEWELFASMLNWALPATVAPPPVRPSVALPLRFGPGDDSDESLSELQADDAWGAIPTLAVVGDGRLTLAPGQSWQVGGFGARVRLGVEQALLEIESSAPADYQGSATVEWRLGQGAWQSTGLQVHPSSDGEVQIFDLLAAGVSTVDDLEALELRFVHDAGSGGVADFDRVWIRLATDGDADGAPDALDCAPDDPGAFAPPSDPWLQAAGPRLEWDDQAVAAGEGTTYELTHGRVDHLLADGGFDRSMCRQVQRPEWDLPRPPAGVARYLRVTAHNACAPTAGCP